MVIVLMHTIRDIMHPVVRHGTAALDFLRHMAAEGATYLFIDVHFSGLSSQDLCSAANQKKAEYLAAWNNQVLTIRRLPTNTPNDALNLDNSAGSSNSGFDLDIDEIAACLYENSTTYYRPQSH